jgi:hypothetical protein
VLQISNHFATLSVAILTRMLLWRTEQDRVIGMSLDMLFQILRTLKGFSTEITLVRFQGNMDSNVGGNMVTFHSGGTARVPAAREIQVVGALSSDMLLTDVLEESFCGWASL